jgi:hypothetical protein
MALINRHPGYLMRMRSDGRKARRTIIAWACLVLLAFNLLAGTALPGQPATAGTGGIAICTATGIVVQDPSGAPSDSQRHDSFCVFCLPLMHGGLNLADSPDLAALPRSTTDLAVPWTAQVASATRLSGSASPRAPPSA